MDVGIQRCNHAYLHPLQLSAYRVLHAISNIPIYINNYNIFMFTSTVQLGSIYLGMSVKRYEVVILNFWNKFRIIPSLSIKTLS
jgi:hypothetical protein